MSTNTRNNHTSEQKLISSLNVLIHGVNPPKSSDINSLNKLLKIDHEENGKINERNSTKNGLNCKNGTFQPDSLNEFIKKGYQICHDSTKFAYLHQLVIHRQIDGILAILDESTDDFSKVRDDVGRTLIHLAVENKMSDVVLKLIAIGIDVNIKTNKGATPLHIAVRQKSLACVKLLLEHGANAIAGDNYKYTPIDCAKAVEALDCLEVLEKFMNENELKHRGLYRSLSVMDTQVHREKDRKKWNSIVVRQKSIDDL